LLDRGPAKKVSVAQEFLKALQRWNFKRASFRRVVGRSSSALASRCFRVERLVKRRNVRIVDLGILRAINPRQVAFDRLFAHVDSPFSWR